MNARQVLWTWAEVCHALGLPTQHGPNFTGIHFDSRLIQPGDLFVPLPGDPGPRFQVAARSDRDGHDYISSAVENGATGVITSRNIESNVPTLQVRDTIEALWALGKYRRHQLNCPVAAVTGSSGKTTLKAFLQAATAGFTTQGSFNNYIGLPLSLALTPRNTSLAIYEIGTNHTGEVAPLSDLAKPTVAVVLNVLAVHIGNFTNLDALEEEKFSICKGLSTEGCLVLPQSLKGTNYVTKDTRTVSFGFDPQADISISFIRDDWYEFVHGCERVRVKVPGGGRHRAESVAACGAALVALQKSLENLHQLKTNLPQGRGNSFDVNEVTIIDDSYNANPTSMIAALRGLRNLKTSGRKIALLGQMNELGTHAAKLHKSIAPEISGVDVVYCVGPLMRYLYEKVESSAEKYFFETANDELLSHIVRHVNQHDAVLVKGSNSIFWQANFVQSLRQELS